MNVRKSIFSYIVLAVFALFCGFSLFCALEAADFARMFGWSQPVLVGAICVYLLLTAAVFIALRTIFTGIRKYIRENERAEAVLSVVLPILVILGIVVYFVFYLMNHIPIMLHDDTFYRMALVTAENGITDSFHGASALYVRLLHGTFLIFGNTPFAGVVLQIILFFISLLLLYIGMQAYAGAIPAAVAIAGFGFFPVTIEYVFSLTPDFFYITLYLLGFYLSGVLYHTFCRAGITSLWQYVFLFFAGLYTGFLIYLDIYSISLYLFFILWYSADKEKNKQAFGANGIALLGGIGGFFLSVAVLALLSGNSTGGESFTARFDFFFRQSVAFYLEKVSPEGNDILKMFPSYDYASFIVFILLISVAFFIVPAVFLQRRSPDSAFVLNMFLLYGLSYWGLAGLQGQMREILCWCMLAGLGIYGVVRSSGKTQEKVSTDVEIKEDITITAEKKREQKKTAPGEPLPNPLPLPEKKRRPQADFAYAVADADMKFDIEVADNDEFDV